MKDTTNNNAMKDTMKDTKKNATMKDAKKNGRKNSAGRANGTTASATAALRFAPTAIIMPQCVAMMRSDLTKQQLDALVIVITLLQPWLTAQLNHEATHSEALQRLTADYGAGDGLLRFPLSWQGTGMRERELAALAEATKAPGLGLRIIHGNSGGSWLYITAKMAACLLDLSKGYFYASPQLCHSLRSRYAVRLYWLMQAYCHQGGFTMSVAQLQAMLCPRTPHGSYAIFERNVIAQPMATLQKLYAEGRLPAYMLFCRLYNRQGKHYWAAAGTTLRDSGRPDALKFTIIRKDTPSPAAAVQLSPTPPAGTAQAATRPLTAKAPLPATTDATDAAQDIVLTLLHEDLQLPEKLAAREAARVTANMRQQFVNYAIMLKEVIDEKRSRKQQLRNQTAYVLACLHRFFEKQEEKEQAKSDEKGQAIAAANGKEQASGTMKPAVLSSGNQERPKRYEETETEEPKQGNIRKGMERQTAADETKKNKRRLPAADETDENKRRQSEKELHRRWQAFLASYSGRATAALGRARLTGLLRDGFLVSFSTADDEKLYRADFDAVQHAARKALDITCRFQPGLIVDR